jgi:hypothetical protein
VAARGGVPLIKRIKKEGNMNTICGNCFFNEDELADWYGCVFSNGCLWSGCDNWIPNDLAMEKLKIERKNWRKTYEARRKYNEEVPEEKRLIINRKGQITNW